MPLVVKTNLDPDLKLIFDSGRPEEAVMLQMVRELNPPTAGAPPATKIELEDDLQAVYDHGRVNLAWGLQVLRMVRKLPPRVQIVAMTEPPASAPAAVLSEGSAPAPSAPVQAVPVVAAPPAAATAPAT